MKREGRASFALAAILASLPVMAVTASAETVHWHFQGKDGTPAPTSITDADGTMALTRYLLGGANLVYAEQDTQADSIPGTHIWWTRDGATNVVCRPGGSVQMYRYELTNNVPKIRHAAHYALDSVASKTLFPANASGELLPFTLEIAFKAASLDADAYNSAAKNFSLVALARGSRTASGNTVFRLNAISGGQLQLQCESKQTGNGDVCSLPAVPEADFRDGNWHHLAMVYELDESKEPHQGTVRVYLDGVLKSSNVFAKHATIRSLKYIESDNSEEKDAYFSVGGIDDRGVDLSVAEVRVTQKALPQLEFMRFGNNERINERLSGTIARWTFDAPGRNGEQVGQGYGAIGSVEGLAEYELAGGTATDTRTWTADGAYPPLFTNDVPCAYVWDPGTGRIANPENSGSVFFRHASEDGESENQSSIGSALCTRMNTLKDSDCLPSNVTFECFAKADKTFKANVSGLFGLASKASLVAAEEVFTRIDLVHGAEPRIQYYVSNVDVNATVVRFGSMLLSDKKWHHIAANWDMSSGTSTVMKLYVDYELADCKETVGTFDKFKRDYLQVIFGGGCGGRAFSGLIDEPRISAGDIGPERFLREFVPRADLTSVWLAPTNTAISGDELSAPDTFWLRGTWEEETVSFSDDLPTANSVLRIRGNNIPLAGSVGFPGAGGITVPCAAVTGTNVFTVEANFCGTGKVFAKKTYLGHDAWAAGVDAEGFAFAEVNGVRTKTSVAADDGCWHHIALAVDRASANTAILYVDGTAAATVDVSGMTVDAGDFAIGEGFEGSMVGVRFSPGALSSGFLVARPPMGLVISVR